ncbi:MAG: serine/threonine protein kinase [Candidatus Zixiibacteriota bacterium]
MNQVAQDTKTVKLGEYTLTGKIGQGGAAEIYRGRQESLNRDVAIKILSTKLTTDPDIVRRFERESMVIAGLNHPNIVHVIDKGQAGGRYFFVMEFIDGTSLRQVIDSDRIPLSTKLEMVVQVCKALDYAHKNGVIHRDIKPTNILIDRQGNPLVADFGIAQIVGTPEADMTASDVIMGTLSYMSPEQRLSSTNIDQTTDLYAIGIILYEILLRKKPLGHFKLPSEIDASIDPRFDGIIQKCLAQEAKDRFQTAVELKDAILEIISGDGSGAATDSLTLTGSESFLGKCRYLDTIRETEFSSTILVENRVSKQLYVIKKHSKGEVGRKESQVLKALPHDNIVRIYGCGGEHKSTVTISEYARGGSLADRMVRRYSWEDATKIVLQVARGLDFAHRNNVVHGDLRPSNVLFDANDNVKLSDFGMPPHYDGPRKKNWYGPPERKQTRQGDIYSMGVIFYQMISGSNPGHDSGNQLIVDTLKPDVPDDVCSMLSKLLAIRVSHRYRTCEEFIHDWDDFDRMRSEQESQPIVTEAILSHQKPSVPVWAMVLIGCGLLAVILLALYFSGVLI